MKLNGKLVLSALLAGILASTVSAGFAKTNTYAEGQFSDVPNSEWYASEVKSTFELGLMNGVGGGIFSPDGNVTVAEAITMASRACATYNGEEIPAAEGEWYQMYVDYAVSKGFVKEGAFEDYDRPAKRHEVASLFENALPEGYFTAKNDVKSIPDVSEAMDYHIDLLNLYKAGVVMGSDSFGNFKPEDNITRAEAAAIINRVALPENRLSKTLDKISDDDAYLLVHADDLVVDGGRNGIVSGWTLDNRGGVPSTDYKINLSMLRDTSTTEGVRLFKEFNKVSTGNMLIETLIDFKTAEGFYFTVNNENGEAVYKLEIKDGAWLLVSDGKAEKICDAPKGNNALRIEIDLDNGKSTTSVTASGNTATLSGKLLTKDANAVNYLYASTEEGKSEFSLKSSYAYVNYTLRDEFKYVADNASGYNWITNGAKVVGEEMNVGASESATRYFNLTSGNAIAEAMLYLNAETKSEMILASGTKTVALLETDGKNILINGEAVYEYHDGLWYDVRFELDTEKMELKFLLNGIERAAVPFKEKATSIDNISFRGKADSGILKIDEIKVFRKIKHDDYVPVPVKPAGEEKYNVGVNICSLWVEGKHYGWETISRFDEPVMGYYTEGIPETADWEIKYMVEHGIDFQAFCWYNFADGVPVKTHPLHDQLDHAYKNAEYSHMMKYALLLELSNRRVSIDTWTNEIVPYIKEHYFKDSRYMSIDGKAVVCSFALGSFNVTGQFDAAENKKMALDALEAAAIECGYEGMIFMSCHSGMKKADEAYIGVDASYNYNFSTSGSSYDTNVTANTYQAKDTAIHTVPTVSVGFSSVGWFDERYPMMSVEDYHRLNKWVTDEYLPAYAEEEDAWKSNTVMLSTWNEFGEGTYINPTKNNGGFGYLDGLREAYTDEKADEKLNIVPTSEQKRRINRMYPSYKQMLVHDGYVSKVSEKEVLMTIDAATNEAVRATQIADCKRTTDGFGGIAATNDPRFILEMFGNSINTKDVSGVRVTLKVPKGSVVELYFKTSADNNYNQDKWLTATADSDGFSTVTFNVSGHKSWLGLLTGLFVDPIRSDGKDKECILKSVEILGNNDLGLPKKMNINGLKFDTKFAPVKADNGDILTPFDLSIGLEYKLDSFVEWDHKTQTITINGEGKSVSFTIDSKKYIANGKEMTLDYKIPSVDGLPAIPFKVMCDALGYEYEYTEDGTTVVNVPGRKGLYENISDTAWEFDVMGYMGGWYSSNATLSINPDGYLEMTNDAHNDPTMFLNLVTPFPAKKYKEMHMRVRYKFADSYGGFSQMFFATNKDGGWSEARAMKMFLKGIDSEGEWLDLVVDLSNVANWDNYITKLRYDPFNSKGTMEIDYIRFIEDPDYVENPEEALDEIPEGPIKLINGDFESDEEGFTSTERYEIVEDPDNPGNHVLKVTPKGDNEIWLYTRQKVRFTPGTTYKVTMDHKMASLGFDDTAVMGDMKTVLIFNMIYSDTKGSNANHLEKQVYCTPQWTHTEFYFTVSKDSDIRSDDCFSFYTNPLNKLGVGYYVDNITITEE